MKYEVNRFDTNRQEVQELLDKGLIPSFGMLIRLSQYKRTYVTKLEFDPTDNICGVHIGDYSDLKKEIKKMLGLDDD